MESGAGVKGSSGGIDWYRLLLDICGQAEGNDGLPTVTTTFEHYYLVRARIRVFE
jgi:hypothetical protein